MRVLVVPADAALAVTVAASVTAATAATMGEPRIVDVPLDLDLNLIATMFAGERTLRDLELTPLILTDAVVATAAFATTDGTPVNETATRLADVFLRGQTGSVSIHGDAVFFGFTRCVTDLPQAVERAALDLVAVRTANASDAWETRSHVA